MGDSSKSKSWLVLKFGGSSVSSRQSWEHITQIVNERKQQGFTVCVVHSALKGISGQLQKLGLVTDNNTAKKVISSIKKQHLALASQLNLEGEQLLNHYFRALENLSSEIILNAEKSPRVQAQLLALGELMATRLGSAFLNKKGIKTTWKDARELLKSTPQKNASSKAAILSAVCDTEKEPGLQQRLAQNDSVILTQGFIARSREGETVLLGRGGSDVSASYFAAKLGAKRLEIWTDVPGLFSANPNEIASARLLTRLSYDEAQEIASNGAHVLHPRSIFPARQHGIPIHVRCTRRPALQGTIIADTTADNTGALKSVALRPNIKLVSMDSLNMWQEVGFLADVFSIFKQFGLSIDLISTSESNITVSLDPSLNVHFNEVQAEFVQTLSERCRVHIIDSVSAISLVGRHIRTMLHRLGDAFEVFREHKIYLVSQAANDLNFTFVVESDQAGRLVRQLHEQVISRSGSQPGLGATWAEMMETDSKGKTDRAPWWQKQQQQLRRIAGEHGSVYVYSREELQRNIQRIRQIDAVDTYFYAMKANAHLSVLQMFYEAGLGFECVSIGEVERVIALFPGINRKRILFTPNFAPRNEYERGFEHQIRLTLDNIFPLRQWPEVFKGREFFLRIDPGHGQGHHKHVKTGGIHSKFGIPRFEIEETARLVNRIDARVTGLHAHAGSGIKDEQMWKNTALILHQVAEQLGGVKILDLGGGFGIRENETESSLNLEKVNQSLQEFKQTYPTYELWIEPGRFLTATAGVLLTRVTQLKGKGEVRYVGVETGMNSFIRPALYGASHTIANLSRLNQPMDRSVHIVGPICESGDKLGIDRRFPNSSEGDIICIANTGAYGHVMSSNYNLRPPASEIMMNDEC